MTSLGARAARGGGITLVFQAAKVALMLASTIVLARLLDPTDFGLIAMVAAIIGVAEIFRDFGLSMAALRATSLSQRQQSNLFWINLGVGVGLTGLGMLAAAPIAAFYGEPRLEQIVLASSVVFALGGATTQFRVRINRELRFFALSWTDFAPYVAGFGAAVLAAVAGWGYWALVVQQLTVATVSLILSVILARWLPSLPHRGEEMKPLLHFGSSFAATQLLSYATRNVDKIALGRVWGPSELGLYDRSSQLVTAPLSQINTPLSRVAIPVLSRIVDDDQLFIQYLRRAQLIATYVTATVFLWLAGIGTPLVAIAMGPDWRPAGIVLSALAVGGVFRSINQIAYWIFMAKGLAGEQLRFFAVAQPLVLGVMLLGLPWGAIGVAVGNSVGFAIYWVASLLWAGRSAKVDVAPLFRDSLRIVGSVGVPVGLIASSCALTLPSDLFQVLGGTVGGALYLLLAYFVIPAVRRDINTLLRFARSALRRG